ncbi:hypothetical protein D3P06_15770 [Paracoccus aestuarii]|uniref:Uncharacterized protein n=1 Tax=Paracoccus aestuarii TaxID=453842 RepID=A0A418ZRW9_9RHOB|nr:hypothetical protein D3P06_15770 [Paracoccus aestuarii]
MFAPPGIDGALFEDLFSLSPGQGDTLLPLLGIVGQFPRGLVLIGLLGIPFWGNIYHEGTAFKACAVLAL